MTKRLARVALALGAAAAFVLPTAQASAAGPGCETWPPDCVVISVTCIPFGHHQICPL